MGKFKCEKCKTKIEIPSKTKEFTCPNCNEKYTITEYNTIKSTDYEYDKIRVNKDNKEEMIEELKLFHYEYMSNYSSTNDFVTLNVRRKNEFNNRDKILKLEKKYSKLNTEFSNTCEEMENLFPLSLCLTLCIFLPVALCWIPIVIPNFLELNGWIITLIGYILIIGIVIFICKLIQRKKYKEHLVYLSEIKDKIEKVYDKLEKLNKEDNVDKSIDNIDNKEGKK